MDYVIDTYKDNPEKADMVGYLKNQMRRVEKEMDLRRQGIKAAVKFYSVLYGPRFFIEWYRFYRVWRMHK